MTIPPAELRSALRTRLLTTQRLRALTLATMLMAAFLPSCLSQNSSLAFTGLLTNSSQGQFNAIQSDISGNLYLLLDQHDGIRILKTDPTATNVLAQAHLGAQGDIALALALDPTGNVYITGTSTSGSLPSTSGAAFAAPAGTSITSFIAKFDSTLNPIFLTFAGSVMMSANSIAATSNAVFITGSIFSTLLPVTPFAILQTPASGSFQNGFVEKFNSTGTTLLYATYLTGAGGNTAPAALVADSAGNTYITGYTSASGYPTIAALVSNIIPSTPGTSSGFVTKLSPAGDGILFSTFIPGAGLTSIALDPIANNLLLSGSVALGQFPVATVATIPIPLTYQVLLRIPLDGSSVLASTLLAPGTQSVVTAAPSGTAWVAGALTLPSLPVQSLSTIGNSFAAHVNAQNVVDQAARFGGLPTSKPSFASALVNLTSLIADSAGQPTFVGSAIAQASSTLLATETYDFPLYNAPTSALPSSLRSSIPTSTSCSGSLCPGSSAYLASLANNSVPSLAVSADAVPNLTLRNLGSSPATGLNITSATFAISTNCAATFAAGAECSIALTGSGPGTLNVQAANAITQTIAIPAFTNPQTPVVFSPKELDFGIQTSSSAPATRTITVTNLTTQPQTFTSKQDPTNLNLSYTLTESASDCTTSGLNTTKLLAAGASCHITLSLAASSTPANDTLLNAQWSIGTQDVLLTGYTQAAALSLSADSIDFGTQYSGSPRLPRFLYLSNSSDAAQSHSLVNSSAKSTFAVQDHCPTQLTARTVCQLQLDYLPPQTPSNDSVTLNLDQGLHALISGQSLPQPGADGPSVNPNLSVSPTSINFPNSVVVTTASNSTQTVTIGNTGANAFALALALSGDFTDTTNCPSLLPGNSTCSVVVTFAPSQPGSRQGLLSVTGGNSSPAYTSVTGIGTPILPANNGTLNLGSIIIGQPSVQWFKVSQSFRALAAAITGTDFAAVLIEDLGYGHGQPPTTAFTSNISGTCFNCWLGLQFTPSAIGTRAATLALSSSSSGNPYTLTLSGTGLPRVGLILTPLTQDFGSVPINSISAPTLFTLTNLTPAPITLTAPSITGDFLLSSAPTGGTACAGTLLISASCFVQVAFAPTISGQRVGTLNLATSAGAAAASLSGFGTPDPGLSFNPTALNFNNLPGPTATLQTIVLTNTGSAPLQIATPTVTLSNFIPSTNCVTLAPAATCTINVAFTPATGPITDTLQIPATISLAGNPVTTLYTIPLAGAYTTQNSGLQIVPTQVSFGPNPIGTLGLTRQFTVNNLTAESLALDISLPHQFVLSGPACAGLAPNASCSFSVTFLPLTNGDITGSIFARANPSDASATLSAIGYVEGYGVGPTTLSITGPISPGNLVNFDQVSSGQSATQTLTLTNKAGGTSANLTIRRITTQWPFRSTTTCGSTLALNQSCTVTLAYTPLNQLPTGTTSPLSTSETGILTIESDALSSPDLIDLAGSAAPALVTFPTNTAPLLSYVASQNSLTFATTQIGNISAPQSVIISNTGTSTLNLLSLQIDPDFSVKNFCDAVVPGASCILSISFNPRADSTQPSTTKIGALEILSDSSSSLDFISLIGSASPPILTLAPLTLDFGTVLLGHSSTQPLSVSNASANTVTFQGLTATGDYVASNGSCPASGGLLPAASSCNLQVVFTPTQAGTRTGSLSLATSTSTLPLTASLTGIGGNSQLQIAPNQLNFGDIAVRASSILSFTLTNTGNIPVTNLIFTTSPGDFAPTTPCTLSTLAPGATCTVIITFTPTALGTRSSTVTITSSDSTSPDIVTLTGNGVTNGTFTLTIDGGSSSTATVTSGHPASYNLTLTPLNNFIGTVVLTCTPILPPDYATCSLLPSSIQLNGSAQNAVATIETVVSINQSKNRFPPNPNGISRLLGGSILCFLTPTLFLFWRQPRLRHSLWLMLVTATAGVALITASGCSHGGDPTLHYATPGTFQYQITASSTTGVQITQSVTLNLNITSR